jgi:DNA-binding CsgD family transcriptional regulator
VIDHCIASIYEAALSPEHWSAAVANIAATVGGGATLVHAPHHCFADGELWMHEVDPACYRTAPPELLTPEHNPGIRAVLSVPTATLVDRRSFIDDQEMDSHPVSLQFFRPNGIEHLLIGAVQMDCEVGSLFVLSRLKAQTPFEQKDKALASELAVHVGRAMRMHRALRLSEARERAFGAALERLAHGVILSDSSLRILHANPSADRIMAAGDGILCRHGHLSLVDRRAQRRLEAAARSIAAGAAGSVEARISAWRPSGGRPYTIALFPALGDGIANVAPKGRVLIFVADSERMEPIRPETLASTFDLTQAEGRVAALAASIDSVTSIATRLGLSNNTVKTHLKAVYQKSGARSRADLIRLAFAGPPG